MARGGGNHQNRGERHARLPMPHGSADSWGITFSSMPLRDYQAAALESLRSEIRAGRRRLLLVAPTGSGKSAIASEMVRGAQARGRRVAFLVHRRDLVGQFSERLTREGVAHGIVMGSDRRSAPTLPVQVVSIATLARRPEAIPAPDLVLLDEGHHAVSKSYLAALERWRSSVVVGYTASPWRLDGRGLGDVYDASVLAAKPRDLIGLGWLSRYSGHAYLAPDLSSVRTVGGDYDEHALTVAYRESRIVGSVVDSWLAHANGRKTILFAPSVDTSRDFCARFRAAGVSAQHVDADSAEEDRAVALHRAASGESLVTCNVGLYTEGTDCPAWSCVILARPTKSTALALQMIGRALRPDGLGPEGRNAEKVALIHDHAEVILHHGLPDADRDYNLTATKRRDSDPLPPVRTCKSCLCCYDPREHPACPACGAAAAAGERGDPEEVAGEEVPLEQAAAPRTATEAERASFRALLEQARSRGRKPGFAVHEFTAAHPGARVPWKVWREYVSKDTRTWRLASEGAAA